MKMITWNCRQRFEDKVEHIFSGSPDIAVIQECSMRSTEILGFDGYRGHWIGENRSKGMAVFYRGDWKVRPLWAPTEFDPRWIIPFEVTGPENFTLIAVWACEVTGNSRASYVGQIHRSLHDHPEWFSLGRVVMAGDFNSNAIWDRRRGLENHSTLVAALEKYGLISAYHAIQRERHGHETMPTFHLYGHEDKPYHLDYVFVPAEWQERLSVHVGSYRDWTLLSDHCPVTIDVTFSGS